MMAACKPSSMKLYAFHRIDVIINTENIYIKCAHMNRACDVRIYCVVLEFTLSIETETIARMNTRDTGIAFYQLWS